MQKRLLFKIDFAKFLCGVRGGGGAAVVKLAPSLLHLLPLDSSKW